MRRADLACGVVLLGLAAAALAEAFRIRDDWHGAKLMPAAVGMVFLLLGAGHLVRALRMAPEAGGSAWPNADGWRRVTVVFGALVLYVAILPYFGFLLATAGVHPTRLPSLPDIPTAKEAGFPELDVVGWQGVSGPPKLPAHVVAKWSTAVEEASKDPAFLEQAEKVNKVIRYLGPQAFWEFMQEEHKKYLPLAIKIGIRK